MMLTKFLVFLAVFLSACVSEDSEKQARNLLSHEEFNHLKAYQISNFEGFYPRLGIQQYLEEDGQFQDEDYEEDGQFHDEDYEEEEESSDPTPSIQGKATKTRGYGTAIFKKRYDNSRYKNYFLHKRQPPPTDEFTYSCPTDVQCNNGGCCSLGDYCAIQNGQLGCCPVGSLCDASPIPGCSVSCYGICCDAVHTLIGELICSPTPGAQGEASGVCAGVEPTSPLFTPPTNNCDLSFEFVCGDECCPSNAGLVCDNATIPGEPFCNIPANVCPRGLNARQGGNCYNVTTDPAAFITSRLPYSSSSHTGSVSLSTTIAGVTINAASNGSALTTVGATGSSESGTGSATGSTAAKSSSGATRSFRGTQEGVRWMDCLGTLGGLVVLGMAVGVMVL